MLTIDKDFAHLLSLCVNQDNLKDNKEIEGNTNLYVAAVNLKLCIVDYVEVAFEAKTVTNLLDAVNNKNCNVICKTLDHLIKYENKHLEELKFWLRRNLINFKHLSKVYTLPILELYLKFIDKRQGKLVEELVMAINSYIIDIISNKENDATKCILLYKVLPIYVKLCPSVTDLLVNILEATLNMEDLLLLVNLQDIVSSNNWLDTMLTSTNYWKLIQNHILSSSGFNQKLAIQLLRGSTDIIAKSENSIVLSDGIIVYDPGQRKKFIDMFCKLCTIIEVLYEKQLHLVMPALNLLNNVQELDESWLICVYTLLLRHVQTSINYIAINDILKRSWYMKAVTFKNILSTLLDSLNNGEYTNASREAFRNLGKFAARLDDVQFVTLMELTLNIQWNPVSSYCLYDALYKRDKMFKLSYDQAYKLVKQATRLPHKDIRIVCLIILIDFLAYNYKTNGIKYEEYKKLFTLIKRTDLFKHTRTLPSNDRLRNFTVPEFKENFALERFVDKTNEIIEKLWDNICKDAIVNLNETATDILQVVTFYKKSYVTAILLRDIAKIETDNIETDKLYSIAEFPKQDLLRYVKRRLFHLNDDDDLYNIKYASFTNRYVITRDIELFKEIANDTSRTFNAKQKEIATFLLSNFDKDVLNAKCNGCLQSDLLQMFHVSKFYAISMDPSAIEECFKFIDTNVDDKQNILLMNRIMYNIFRRREDNKRVELLEKCLSTILNFVDVNVKVESLEMMFDFMILNVNIDEEFYERVVNVAIQILNCHRRLVRIKIKNCDISMRYLVELLLYEEDVRKHERAEYEVSTRNRDYNRNHVTEREFILNYSLSQVIRDENNIQFVDSVVVELIGRYKKNFNKRYFPDSQLCHEKMRIVQTLLITHKKCSDNMRKTISRFILESLLMESHQNCVKHLMQLLLILINRDAVAIVFPIFKDKMRDENARVPSKIALLPIIYHLIHGNECYYEDFLITLLPFTMGPNFKLRLHSQYIIAKLFASIPDNSAFAQRYSRLRLIIREVLQSTDEKSKRDELNKEEFLINVHPEQCYALNTIYNLIPRRYNALQTKLIVTTALENVTVPLKIVEPIIPFLMEELNSTSGNDDVLSKPEDVTTVDIQKKIMPIKELDQIESMSKKKSNLILIATLIESAANLGGLTRTCEIYGVNKLILNDAKIVTNKDYKSLSLSSEKWVEIVEKKERNLIDYLLELKSEAYAVIGLEQTTNSLKLNDYKFLKNTALLLGNERTGIPSSLIPILDTTLEIPQFGMIRSLNVHVAGAICIWEYSKQYYYQ